MISSIDGEAVAALIAGRRTIHDFEPERLPPRATLLRAIELATRAPNHYLSQPWNFYLLGPQTQQAIVELNAEMVEAEKGEVAAQKKRERWSRVPGWLVLTCAQSDRKLRRREDYAACACAVQNLSLYLWSEGVGVKWTTGAVIRNPRFYDLLGVDAAAEQLVGLLWYGYPEKIPTTPRKPVERVITDLP